MPTLQKIKPYFKPSKNREPFTFRFAKIIGLGLGLLFTTSVISQTSTGLRIKQNAQSQTIESAASSTVSSLDKDQGSQSPFDAVKGKKEDFSKRDLYSKHYVNEDGSFTALIGAGPIHYEKNGQFLDIDHKIQTNSNINYPFVNKTNLFESYFGASAHQGVKNKTGEGEIREFLNTKMYWEVNGQAVNTVSSADVPISIQEDKAYYNGLYGNISAEFITLTGKRKLNYVIPAAQDLGNIPANADYLVFTEDVELPNGWMHVVSENGVSIKNANGATIYLYENPSSTDAANELSRNVNTVFETEVNGNVLTIKTKVEIEWLMDVGRVFPVKVDPTVTVYPTAIGNYNTGSIDNAGSGNKTANNDIYIGMRYAYGQSSGTRRFFRGWASFDLTTIPNSANISSTKFGFYSGLNSLDGRYGQYVKIGPITSGIPNQATGGTLYNMCAENTEWLTLSAGQGGNVTIDLNALQIAEISNSLPSNIFSFGFAPVGDYDTGYTEQVGIYGSTRPQQTSNGKPYLTITYIIPVNCLGTPTGGTAAVIPFSGTHGTNYTASVTGSTSASGITYQWQSATSSSGPWSDISGATNGTYGGTAPYENGITYYRRMITCTNSNQSTYSSVTSFTTTCNPSHIEGNAPGGGYGYIGISNVSLGDINNTTGYQNSSPAYNNYTYLSTDLTEGQAYILKVKYTDQGSPVNRGKIGAWIDWTGDGNYSAPNDFLGVVSNVDNNQVVEFTFTVPTGTTLGTKRLRIRSTFNTDPLILNDACTIFEYGETEDYNVNVIAAPLAATIQIAASPNLNICIGTTVIFTAIPTFTAGNATYQWKKNNIIIPGETSLIYTTSTLSNADEIICEMTYNLPPNYTNALINSNTITMAMPIAGSPLSNTETATCVVNGSQWVQFYGITGRLLGEVNAQGEDLGAVEMKTFVGPAMTMEACGTSDPFYHTAYMGRRWVMKSSEFPNGIDFPTNTNITVRLPFTDLELDDLNGHANTTTFNPNDGGLAGLADISNLMLTKITGSTENGIADAADCNIITSKIRAIPTIEASGMHIHSISNTQYLDFKINQFSEFFLHKNFNNSPLPVALTNFSATCDNNITLSWTTASEQNSDRYIIEKSRDGQTWAIVAEQAAAGNSNTLINYSQVDENSWNGTAYYRLRQLDFNGEQEVFGPISVSCNANENTMIVYPNPGKGAFTVEISSDAVHPNANLVLTDMTGKIISSQKVNVAIGKTHLMMDHLDLQMGTYMIQIRNADAQLKPVKMVINR